MKAFNYMAFGFAFLLLGVSIYSCSKFYINHDFRETYKQLNDSIHFAPTQNAFFKVHHKNGDVTLFETWALNNSKDSIIGDGSHYDFNRNELQNGYLSININDIAIIETNQLDAIKSKDKSRIAGLSILTGANLLLDAVCITNPKACFGSCPTFYIDENASLDQASAEGFSSSIAPSLEKRDLDALKFSTDSDNFSITMKNEAFETHMINELYIQAISKKSNEQIYHDINNVYYNCTELINPAEAKVDNISINEIIKCLDNTEYFSSSDDKDLGMKEEIVLEFKNLTNKDYGLVIDFRQTLLTTYLLYSGISFMGNEVGDYFAKIETNRLLSDLLNSPFNRLGKIYISYWNENHRKWYSIQEIYETGPIAKNIIIVPLNNIQIENQDLKIKLEMAKGLWRIDYLALAKITSQVEPLTIYPSSLDIIDGASYSIKQIKHDDDDYLVSFPGNAFKFKFNLPLSNQGFEYELFLSSKGYYLEWIRQDWLSSKNPSKLKKMLRNDNDLWKELASEFKVMEPYIEDVFWNSKYLSLR